MLVHSPIPFLRQTNRFFFWGGGGAQDNKHRKEKYTKSESMERWQER